MVQNIRTLRIPAGGKKIIFEKPFALCRIFFSINVMTSPTEWYETKISFDDPLFHTYYSLNGSRKYFEAKGVDIFQGNIWVWNQSTVGLVFSATEILQ